MLGIVLVECGISEWGDNTELKVKDKKSRSVKKKGFVLLKEQQNSTGF